MYCIDCLFPSGFHGWVWLRCAMLQENFGCHSSPPYIWYYSSILLLTCWTRRNRHILWYDPRLMVAVLYEFAECHGEEQAASGCQGLFPQLFPRRWCCSKTGEGQKDRTPDKGALFFKYNRDVHEWLTHLRRVHAENPPVTMNGKPVKASNPLAAPGEALYYYHSKTACYNDFFFDYWC